MSATRPLTYTLFDPTACGFPEPRVPLLATLTLDSLGSPQSRFQLVGRGRPRRTYSRGRYALYDAYRLSGVGPDSALLAPAYHCRTMLDPAISLGAELMLYPLRENLAPDLEGLAEALKRAQRPVRAMLMTHYFGFPQDTAPIAAFCREHGIALIEDCSHALFNLKSKERLGQHGRFTIASPYKLFPCEEGGLLLAGNDADLPTERRPSAGLTSELRVLASALRRKSTQRRNGALGTRTAQLAEELARARQPGGATAGEGRAVLDGTSRMYQPAEQPHEGPHVSEWLMRLCAVDHVAQRRRQHYLRWRDAMLGLPNCRPLFPELPDDCVPYMFPLLIDQPETHFYQLKRVGMPIWRWDEMAVSDCPVSQRYSRRLLHLPCHQTLTASELDWMIAAVTLTMRAEGA